MLKRLKRNKAAGPDDIPIELFQFLDDGNRKRVLNLINHWWNRSVFPEDKLTAYIASIYKKGDPKKQENYRPISLLCSVYKIYAALLQRRLASALDDDISKTQFGFRQGKSTSILLGHV